MSLFNKLTSDGLEESQDRLGGFSPFDSDIYIGTIKVAYAGTSSGGATSVSVVVDADGKEYRETFYVTNKKGENFFISQDKKKVPLPGFTVVDDICLIASGKPLANQETEEKVIKLYDFEQRAEVPKSVPVLTDLIGQKIALGILKQLENKNAKNAAGEYEATEETREVNVVDKVFHPEMKLTVAEARNGKEDPEFWDKWVEKNKGTVRDKTEKKASGNAGAPPKPAAAGGTAAPRQSLFGKKP